jgi:hypothetical protein
MCIGGGTCGPANNWYGDVSYVYASMSVYGACTVGAMQTEAFETWDLEDGIEDYGMAHADAVATYLSPVTLTPKNATSYMNWACLWSKAQQGGLNGVTACH